MILALQALLVWVLSSFLAKIFLGAGLILFSYVGISTAIEAALDSITGAYNNLGAAGQILAMAGLGEFLSVVGSAVVTVATFYAARVFLGRS